MRPTRVHLRTLMVLVAAAACGSAAVARVMRPGEKDLGLIAAVVAFGFFAAALLGSES